MVGSVVLSKIMKFKHNRGNKKVQINEDINEESPLDYYNNLCRICLNRGTIPIFGSAYQEDISETVNLFGSIQVHIDDEYPKLLCVSCHCFILNARLFKNTAKSTDQLLKESKVNIKTILKNKEKEKKSFLDFPTLEEIDAIKNQVEPKPATKPVKRKGTCEICHKTFTLRYYKLHMKTHTEKDVQFVCEVCGKKFLLKGNLKKHRQIHINHLPFKCTLCPYRGRFSENLRSHMRSHMGEKHFKCSHCPFRSANKGNLNRHMLTHKTEKEFKCSCGKSYHMKKELDNHFKVDHAGIKEHICNLCGKEFGYRKRMMQHQRVVHKRQKFQSGRMPLYLQLGASSCNGFNKY